MRTTNNTGVSSIRRSRHTVNLTMTSKHGDSKPHVCIVGTGISGLRCADVLLENGFKVTMLEARNRIGGRVSRSIMIRMSEIEAEFTLRSVKATNLDIQRTCK